MVIGAFIAQLDDAYQRSVWKGISSRIRETGNGVVCFIGQRLDAPTPSEASRNIAYHLADRESIDGLIVLSSTIGTLSGQEGVRKLLKSKLIPQVSVGLEMPGIPSVSVNGIPAMTEMVRHVIHAHGKRRIALLAAPPGHKEADERESVFRRVLQEEGIEFDERLLERGTFLRESGCEAARILIEKKIPFDALICLNDRMALGAMQVLREANFTIPGDVLVTGFDDIGEARWESPPLTTIYQPLELMGQVAVDMTLELLGGQTPANRVLECALVVRQSCGCPVRRTMPHPGLIAIRHEDNPRIDRLCQCVLNGDADNFLELLYEALVEETGSFSGLARWRKNLQYIRHYCHPTTTSSEVMQIYAEADALVSEAENRLQAARRIEAEERHIMIRELSAELAGAFGMAPMLRHLDEGLSRLGIRNGYLALFENQTKRDGVSGPSKARLILAHCQNPKLGVSAEGKVFSAAHLLPPDITSCLDKEIWMLEPLVYREEPLGYLLLEGGANDPTMYETLRDQVSSTLKGTLLLEQIQRHEHDLEKQVKLRTSELTFANQKLMEQIDQRRILEKQVQEISNRTMQTIGQDLHDDLCQQLAGIAMFVSVIETRFSTSGEASLDEIHNVRQLLEKAAARSRQIARGLYPPSLEERGLVIALEDLVESMGRNIPIRISFEAEEGCHLADANKALQFYRIVQESLTNAIKHSHSDLIMVRLFRDEGDLVAEVRDFGRGFPAEIPENGMGLRIMRYRSESIGAKLFITGLDPGACVSCRIAIMEESDGRNG